MLSAITRIAGEVGPDTPGELHAAHLGHVQVHDGQLHLGVLAQPAQGFVAGVGLGHYPHNGVGFEQGFAFNHHPSTSSRLMRASLMTWLVKMHEKRKTAAGISTGQIANIRAFSLRAG
jgi:hypothetical protein